MAIKSSFTTTGVSIVIGRGPVYYRLNCSSIPTPPIDYFFGKGSLGADPRNLIILTGTWIGQIDIQYSLTPDDAGSFTDIPGESYTANTARFFNG